MGKVSLLECPSSHNSDSGVLAERFDESTMLIEPHVQHSETSIRRVETVPTGFAEKDRTLSLTVDAREERSRSNRED